VPRHFPSFTWLLFTEFHGARFTLLWAAAAMVSALDFHGRCDAHMPPLAMIQDRGSLEGFTPVDLKTDSWERGIQCDQLLYYIVAMSAPPDSDTGRSAATPPAV
jgi:hypothetical protein